jgi:hypothetical protein
MWAMESRYAKVWLHYMHAFTDSMNPIRMTDRSYARRYRSTRIRGVGKPFFVQMKCSCLLKEHLWGMMRCRGSGTLRR